MREEQERPEEYLILVQHIDCDGNGKPASVYKEFIFLQGINI